jgi:hypothetical protein
MANAAKSSPNDALAELVERARSESIGSIDHAANAKAIALTNAQVQDAIRELLERDFQLIAIKALRGYGSSLMSFPISFTFRPGPDAGAVALNENFVVLVELPTRSVKRISKSAETPEGADAPFVLAANARFEPPTTPLSANEARYAREAAYYQSLGLGGTSGYLGGADTDETNTLRVDHVNTSSQTESVSYKDNVADDTMPDPSNHDDSEEKQTWVADHNDDLSSGDPWLGGGPGGFPGGGFPTGPGGGLPPRPGGGWPWPDPPPPYGWRYRGR